MTDISDMDNHPRRGFKLSCSKMLILVHFISIQTSWQWRHCFPSCKTCWLHLLSCLTRAVPDLSHSSDWPKPGPDRDRLQSEQGPTRDLVMPLMLSRATGFAGSSGWQASLSSWFMMTDLQLASAAVAFIIPASLELIVDCDCHWLESAHDRDYASDLLSQAASCQCHSSCQGADLEPSWQLSLARVIWKFS